MNLKTNMLHENKDIAQLATTPSFSIHSISFAAAKQNHPLASAKLSYK